MFAAVCSSFSADFGKLEFALGEDLDALVNMVFLGVDLGVGFGDIGVGFGVGSSISLFAAGNRGCSLFASSAFCKLGSGEREGFARGDSPVVGSVVALARSTSPSQTIFCAFGEFLASTLQRINPAMSATCASAISVTFRQKRQFFDIYFGSALVAMPTFVISACFTASISAINFCTGNSRSGRITTATSGLVCFN